MRTTHRRSAGAATALALPLALAAGQATATQATGQSQATEPRAIQVTAHDYRFEPSRIIARPGQTIVVELANRGDAPHNIEFELPTGERELEEALSPGDSGQLRFSAPQEPGEYTLYCPVDDHAEHGMTGTLVVRRGGPADPAQQDGKDKKAKTVEGDFKGPESALHDEEADAYLVSNVNGGASDKDGNGFISKISPEGEVEELRWIDGESDGVTLHAPKGMALANDTLYVADVDAVRLFDRNSGEPKGEWTIDGATFVNDVAVGPDGAVYATDTAISLSSDAEPTKEGPGAVYRFDQEGNAQAIAEGDQFNGPNGIVAHQRGVTFVSFLGKQIWQAPARGEPRQMGELPEGRLDGLVRLPGGSLLVSSWEAEAVYQLSPAGQHRKVAENVKSPADIGFDAQRHRILLPMLTEDEFRLVSMPDEPMREQRLGG